MDIETIKVVELPNGWVIIWPSGRPTVAPTASDALRRIRRHGRRRAPSIVEIVWDTRSASGKRVVRALQD